VYCCFYTSPPGLLDGVPRTPVKWKVAGDGAISSAALSGRFALPSRSADEARAVEWAEAELPLLHVNVASRQDLDGVTLIVAVYDKDCASQDDALGAVWLPLSGSSAGLVQPTKTNPVTLVDRGVPEQVERPKRRSLHRASTEPRRATFSAGGPASSRRTLTRQPSLLGSPGRTAAADVMRFEEPILLGHMHAARGWLRCEVDVSEMAKYARNRSKRDLPMTAIEDSVIIERVRRSEASKPWYIIDPRSSRFIIRWDLATAAALIFTALVTPWEVSYLSTPPLALFIINRLIDGIFIVDVALQFLIMYPIMYEGALATEGRRWVSSPAKIATRYMRGWFAFDVLSIAPAAFDIQAWVLTHYSTDSDADAEVGRLFLLRVIRVLRLVKLFRLVRGSRLLKRWSNRVSLPASSLRGAVLVGTLLLFMHWMACLLALQTTFSDPMDTWLGRYGYCVLAGEPDAEPECVSPWVLWLHTLLWALRLIGNAGSTPVRRGGFGAGEDGDGLTDSEAAWVLVLTVLGMLLWAYILASVVDIIINVDPDTRLFRNSLDALNRYLNQNNLPHENPELCEAVREYFGKSMHLHRAHAHSKLYTLMSPTLQGMVVRQIPWHAKWMRELGTLLDSGRGGLLRNGDVVRLEVMAEGRNLVTHLPTGVQIERQDFHAALKEPLEVILELDSTEEGVGAPIAVRLPGSADGDELYAEFFNPELVAFRRTLQTGEGGTFGLATPQGSAADKWVVPPYGRLLVTEPRPLPSLPPIEDSFLIQVATSLSAMVFAPTELLPTGRLYVIHRGLALFRQRWLGVGAMWGLEMVLQEDYLQRYNAVAVSYLETYSLDRAQLMSIVADHEHAAKRLRRYAIFKALAGYMIANKARFTQLHDDDGDAPFSAPPRPTISGTSSSTDSSGAARVEHIASRVSDLNDGFTHLRGDVQTLKTGMAQLLLRIPPA
jgi:hypothetical protein